MAAIGQGAGGGAAGGTGEGAGAPGTGQPANGAAPENNDPWGFGAAVAGAPEHLRPMLQTEFDRINPTLTEQMGRYQPLDPFVDQLTPLLAPADPDNPDSPSQLQGVLAFLELVNDESREAEFETWWETVGKSYGFLDDDGEPAGGEGAAAAQTGDEPNLEALDPAVRAHIERLEARLGEHEGNLQQSAQQQAVDREATRISNELTGLMKQHGIGKPDNAPGDWAPNLQSPEAIDIFRIAGGYGGDPKAIENAVTDYLRIKGGAQSALVQQGGQQLSGVEALQAALGGGGGGGNGTPGAALDRGLESERIKDVHTFDEAKRIATERFRQS